MKIQQAVSVKLLNKIAYPLTTTSVLRKIISYTVCKFVFSKYFVCFSMHLVSFVKLQLYNTTQM